jgi:hypothetical protein
MHKNLKALQELQDRRKAEERQTPHESVAKPKTLAAGAGPASGHEEKPEDENKFVFSNAQTAPQGATPGLTSLDPPKHNPEPVPQKAAGTDAETSKTPPSAAPARRFTRSAPWGARFFRQGATLRSKAAVLTVPLRSWTKTL